MLQLSVLRAQAGCLHVACRRCLGAACIRVLLAQGDLARGRRRCSPRHPRPGLPARTHLVYVHAHGVHGGVPDLVVRRVDEDLIKDLVQARRVCHRAEREALPVVHPKRLLLLLGAADVGVGAQQDVLQLRLLLVDVLDRLARMVALGPGGRGGI